MQASQSHVTADIPMGATLVDGGATFRVWAPAARHVYVAFGETAGYQPRPEDELVKDPTTGHWTGFFPGVADGTKYRYLVAGDVESFLKRDPWARELEMGDYRHTDGIVRDLDSYPWHDAGFRPPRFRDLIVYQLHVGVFYARDDQGRDRRPYRVAKLLDALDRVEYLADLGVTAVQLLPVVEFQGEWSLGYNGTDLFSPETDYSVDPADLGPYLPRINRLLAARNAAPLTAVHLGGQINQLKAFVDICHLYGIAVIIDVVYNHAGGGFDRHSIDYFDLPANPGPGNNMYFSAAHDPAGGRIFDFVKPQVQSFLIENAKMFLGEYHADGLRFDEVGVIVDNAGGWSFCQNLTATLRYHKPAAVLISEYWRDPRYRAVQPPPDGLNFDVSYADALRREVRAVLTAASGGAHVPVHIERLIRGLHRPDGFRYAWQVYNHVENHDLVLDMAGDHRYPRIPRLADPDNPRSWYARSRSRVIMGLLLTAPGVPMLFMGQEFLEDKLWSDNPRRADRMIWWDGVDGADRHMRDFHAFTRELMWLRRRHPALRDEPVVAYPVDDRVLAFHRWVPGSGRDVVVVLSLHEHTFYDRGYRLGFPQPGRWREQMNSDWFDHLPNPHVHGNAGGIVADGPPLHGMPHSAGITLPANSILVFTRDDGD